MTRRTGLKALLDEDLLLIHPQDAKDKNIADGELVTLSSARGSISIRALLSEAVKPGILSTTFHFPDIQINKLSGDICDSETMCPEYKVIAADITRII
jgi:formate dehydrogenase major subunit